MKLFSQDIRKCRVAWTYLRTIPLNQYPKDLLEYNQAIRLIKLLERMTSMKNTMTVSKLLELLKSYHQMELSKNKALAASVSLSWFANWIPVVSGFNFVNVKSWLWVVKTQKIKPKIMKTVLITLISINVEMNLFI